MSTITPPIGMAEAEESGCVVDRVSLEVVIVVESAPGMTWSTSESTGFDEDMCAGASEVDNSGGNIVVDSRICGAVVVDSI